MQGSQPHQGQSEGRAAHRHQPQPFVASAGYCRDRSKDEHHDHLGQHAAIGGRKQEVDHCASLSEVAQELAFLRANTMART